MEANIIKYYKKQDIKNYSIEYFYDLNNNVNIFQKFLNSLTEIDVEKITIGIIDNYYFNKYKLFIYSLCIRYNTIEKNELFLINIIDYFIDIITFDDIENFISLLIINCKKSYTTHYLICKMFKICFFTSMKYINDIDKIENHYSKILNLFLTEKEIINNPNIAIKVSEYNFDYKLDKIYNIKYFINFLINIIENIDNLYIYFIDEHNTIMFILNEIYNDNYKNILKLLNEKDMVLHIKLLNIFLSIDISQKHLLKQDKLLYPMFSNTNDLKKIYASRLYLGNYIINIIDISINFNNYTDVILKLLYTNVINFYILHSYFYKKPYFNKLFEVYKIYISNMSSIMFIFNMSAIESKDLPDSFIQFFNKSCYNLKINNDEIFKYINIKHNKPFSIFKHNTQYKKETLMIPFKVLNNINNPYKIINYREFVFYYIDIILPKYKFLVTPNILSGSQIIKSHTILKDSAIFLNIINEGYSANIDLNFISNINDNLFAFILFNINYFYNNLVFIDFKNKICYTFEKDTLFNHFIYVNYNNFSIKYIDLSYMTIYYNNNIFEFYILLMYVICEFIKHNINETLEHYLIAYFYKYIFLNDKDLKKFIKNFIPTIHDEVDKLNKNIYLEYNSNKFQSIIN